MRRVGNGFHVREVPLESHGTDRFTGQLSINVVLSSDHARLEIDGYWHSADVAMSHAELAAVRDAINAVLAEGSPS